MTPEAQNIEARSIRIREALAERLGVKSNDLETALRRAQAHLPRRIRAHGDQIVAAAKIADHPKLRNRIDLRALARAEKEILQHLEGINPAERRKDFWLGLAGVIAFNILVIVGLFVVWLVLSGTS